MKNVKDIIIEYLIKNKFDGLTYDNCGCGIDDLLSCGNCFPDCFPAKKIIVTQKMIDNNLFDYFFNVGDEIYIDIETWKKIYVEVNNEN